MERAKDFPIYTGEDARNKLNEILGSAKDDGKNVHYPAYIGTVGYFMDKSGTGEPLVTAYDNLSGDCWVENFQTEDGAEKWVLGEMSTDEVRQMESNIDSIILYKDSFPVLQKSDTPKLGELPPFVKFDNNGEMYIKMSFYDGYAFDTNPHGLGMYDRTALYYPTVDEVSKSVEMQDAIEKYTGRCWAEGSRQEQIYDIALKFGKASRLHCPQERYDAAVKAIVERATDPRAKSFTPEQRGKIELAAASSGNNLYHDVAFRQTFYEMMFGEAKPQLRNIPAAWSEDAKNELYDLCAGKVREEGRGLHR